MLENLGELFERTEQGNLPTTRQSQAGSILPISQKLFGICKEKISGVILFRYSVSDAGRVVDMPLYRIVILGEGGVGKSCIT